MEIRQEWIGYYRFKGSVQLLGGCKREKFYIR
jgi:hypothetical protein